MSDERPATRLRVAVAEEVRVMLARRRLSGVQLANRMGRSQAYVSRRLTGDTAFDVDDLEVIARELGVSVLDLIRGTDGQTTAAKIRLTESTGGARKSVKASAERMIGAHAVDPRNRRPARIPAGIAAAIGHSPAAA